MKVQKLFFALLLGSAALFGSHEAKGEYYTLPAYPPTYQYNYQFHFQYQQTQVPYYNPVYYYTPAPIYPVPNYYVPPNYYYQYQYPAYRPGFFRR